MRRATFVSILAAACSACASNSDRSAEADSGLTATNDSLAEDTSASDPTTTGPLPSETETTASEESTTETETGTDTDATTGEPGTSLGVFDLTYYWVAYEGDYDGAPDTEVGDCNGVPLATVPAGFASALKLEGSGKLLDDRILNIGGCGCGGGFDCFAELDPRAFPWGQGSKSNPLLPFITLATDTSVLAFGTSVYAPDLDGVILPDGSSHDGCLRAGDVGGGIGGMHIDWFVGLKANYLTLDPDVPETVELFDGGTACP